MGCLPPVFQCEGWFWGLREFSEEFKLGKSDDAAEAGEGEVAMSNPEASILSHLGVGAGWGCLVAGSFRGCGLWIGCCSWRTGGEWAQAEGYAFSLKLSSVVQRGASPPGSRLTEEMAPGCWACGISGLPPSYRNFNWIANRLPWDKRRNLPRALRVPRLQTHRA